MFAKCDKRSYLENQPPNKRWKLTMDETVKVRKRPVQARSQARVDAILSSAAEIISEIGSDRLKMSELAARAGVPIGTVYQFFPNKSSIIHTLAQESVDRVRRTLIAELSDFDSIEDATNRLSGSIYEYYRYFKNAPVARDIWSSTQGDKLLQEIDMQDSRQNASILFDNLKSLFPKTAHERLSATCFLCVQLTGNVVRLAVTQEDELAQLMLDQYAAMLRAGIRELAEISADE